MKDISDKIKFLKRDYNHRYYKDYKKLLHVIIRANLLKGKENK